MIGKTPAFWYRPFNSAAPFVEKILIPFSCLYQMGHIFHQYAGHAYKIDVPVICVGNLNAGGAGKTPVALSLMEMVQQRCIAAKPFFLTRGHGGNESGPLLADLARHTPRDIGDEPLILAHQAPTIVAADRAAGGRFALSHHADLIIMDDGLQNPGLFKDLKCIVVNGEMGFGNGRLLPAGPLRAPLQSLKDADMFVLIGEDRSQVKARLPAQKPLFTARLTADPALHTKPRYIAFAGLGYPHKFFDFLRDTLQLNLVETRIYADHYPYSQQDIETLRMLAVRQDATLITTQKDYMRLPDTMDGLLEIVQSRLIWDEPECLYDFLKEKLQGIIR